MRKLQYHLDEGEMPLDALRAGIQSLTLVRGPGKLLLSVFLECSGGKVVRVRSRMHDIEERLEVGVLEFSAARKTEPSAGTKSIVSGYESDISLNKLALQLEGCEIESGIEIISRDEGRIVVLAGASPYSLAVKAQFLNDDFQSEYPLEKYKRIPV